MLYKTKNECIYSYDRADITDTFSFGVFASLNRRFIMIHHLYND